MINANPDYISDIAYAVKKIEQFGEGYYNNVMASLKIIEGVIAQNDDKILCGDFTICAKGVEKKAKDLAAAIMIHSSLNTRGEKKIILDNDIVILEG